GSRHGRHARHEVHPPDLHHRGVRHHTPALVQLLRQVTDLRPLHPPTFFVYFLTPRCFSRCRRTFARFPQSRISHKQRPCLLLDSRNNQPQLVPLHCRI